MRKLLGERNGTTHAARLGELFLQRLPQHIHLVLAVAGDITVDRLSELADQVNDVASPLVTVVSPTADPAISRLEARIGELTASIAAFRRPFL